MDRTGEENACVAPADDGGSTAGGKEERVGAVATGTGEDGSRNASNGQDGGGSATTGEVDLDVMDQQIRFHKDVEEFLQDLHDEVYKRDEETIRKLYENDFNQLTEKHFAESRWPSVDEVSRFYKERGRFHCLIVTLYSELFYRHVFSRCSESLSWEDRKRSWENYTDLLTHFVDDECKSRPEDPPNTRGGLRLPPPWVWDMLDEFVYQYQETCRWRMRLGRRATDGATDKEALLKTMKNDREVWKGAAVLEYLHLLVERSGIKEYMKRNKEEFSRSHAPEIELKYQLGYFAMISLLRVHVLMGNYRLGVQMVSDVEISARSLYLKAPACHITIFYNLGFAYMMMRRYFDAIRHMSQLLTYVSKQRGYLASQSYQQSAMTKLTDRMFLLVMMCSALCSSRVDEAISAITKDKYPDKFYKLQHDDEDTYRDMFVKACPKFINPVIPSYEKFDELERLYSAQTEPHQRQLNIFIKEMRYLKNVMNVRSFAKLYNNIQLQKLASLMEVKDTDAEEAVRSEMMCVKHKSRQQIWRTGSLLSGDVVSTTADVEFYLDHDTLHVKSSKSQAMHTEYFLKQINRCQDVLQSIQRGGGTPSLLPFSAGTDVGGSGKTSSSGGRGDLFGSRGGYSMDSQQTPSINANAERLMAS